MWRQVEQIPADGDVVDGAASVDESAITGESAPVIRESGGDRSAVTGGTTVTSDWLVIKVSNNPGESFMDKMIAMVEGASRKKTPNELALQIFLVALSIIFVLVTLSLYAYSLFSAGQGNRESYGSHLTGCTLNLSGADDDRRAAFRDRYSGYEPGLTRPTFWL